MLPKVTSGIVDHDDLSLTFPGCVPPFITAGKHEELTCLTSGKPNQYKLSFWLLNICIYIPGTLKKTQNKITFLLEWPSLFLCAIELTLWKELRKLGYFMFMFCFALNYRYNFSTPNEVPTIKTLQLFPFELFLKFSMW